MPLPTEEGKEASGSRMDRSSARLRHKKRRRREEVKEASGSSRNRSSARLRNQKRRLSESQEPGPTASVRRREQGKDASGSRRNRSSARLRHQQRRLSESPESEPRVKKITMREEVVLPSDAATSRKQEEDETKEVGEGKDELEAVSSALCGRHNLEEVIGDVVYTISIDPEVFRMEEEEAKRWQDEDAVSSAPSSPLCEPRIPQDSNDGICKPTDLETFRAYRQCNEKFKEKLACKMKLPTLDESVSSYPSDEELHLGHQYAIKDARKFVFALSSSIGGKPLTKCSGFFIGWDNRDESSETGIILTSAHLICSKQPSLDSWLCKDEYAPDAEVIVHFPDKTTSKCKLCYYQKHYNIALFSTKVNPYLTFPLFNCNVNYHQKVLMLGRDESSILKINYGRVQFKNPGTFERHHFMYTNAAAPECGIGGPIVDFNGWIVGMSTPDTEGSFIPASVIRECFHMWSERAFLDPTSS